MFLYKSCPRCRGDLNLTLERELVCLQCGHEVAKDAAQTLVAEYVAARRARQASLPATVRRAA
jgi:uncharacterized membrane protein YvbJ